MIRLTIADDHPVIIDGIKTILDQQEEIVLLDTVHDGNSLIESIQKEAPDIILMDINMPGMNGIEATSKIRKEYPEVRVLAFSQYKEKRFVKQILKSGASGYLLKNSAGNELVKAIQMVMDGGMYLSADLPGIFDDKPKRSDRLFPDLTPREIDVLKCICEEKNTQEIADTLFISANTVETHRANLLLKVGAKNTAGLVKWAVENEIV
jgi:DNA-binding NarL/FixJ family response regulator